MRPDRHQCDGKACLDFIQKNVYETGQSTGMETYCWRGVVIFASKPLLLYSSNLQVKEKSLKLELALAPSCSTSYTTLQ